MANLETTKEQIILLDEIQDELECVVCLDTPGLDPIYQCEQGHLLCKSCHGKLTDCPICKAKLGNTRCLAAEKISCSEYLRNLFENIWTKFRFSIFQHYLHLALI